MALPPTPQSGALPYRQGPAGIEVLIVTSRRTGRWHLPKGGIAPGLSASASAAKEAFEEAGVCGRIGPESVGAYTYRKGGRDYRVDIYLLEVEEILPDWEEAGQRRREWVPAADAPASWMNRGWPRWCGRPSLPSPLRSAGPAGECLADGLDGTWESAAPGEVA